MNFELLEKNIIDFIQEQNLKIGYRSEPVRIYYFLSSLNRYAGQKDGSIDDMNHYLTAFAEYEKENFGEIRFSNSKDRFCLIIPEKGNDYIHSLPAQDTFLPALLDLVSVHGCTYENLLDLFRKFSPDIHTENIRTEDFDYLIYFENGIPNDYRYCFKEEGEHMIYHRFTPGDYEDIFA